MKKILKSKLPGNVITKSAYSAVRLRNRFNIKIKIVKQHQHDIIYYGKCPEGNCNENYIRETSRRLSERVIDYNGRNKNSHIFKHSVEREHRPTSLQEISLFGGNYHKNKFCRKVAESLLIKKKR